MCIRDCQKGKASIFNVWECPSFEQADHIVLFGSPSATRQTAENIAFSEKGAMYFDKVWLPGHTSVKGDPKESALRS